DQGFGEKTGGVRCFVESALLRDAAAQDQRGTRCAAGLDDEQTGGSKLRCRRRQIRKADGNASAEDFAGRFHDRGLRAARRGEIYDLDGAAADFAYAAL